jgi:two-component system cell cycle sensor histidine kinase/response regulator CckA
MTLIIVSMNALGEKGRLVSTSGASLVNVLIVEDEPVVALDLSATVQHEGHSVCAVASSGEEAVELAAAFDPDVVFMDYKLEGELNGLQAAKRIRARHRARIVFVTAQQDAATRRELMASEPFAFIAKPFSDRAVIEVLRRACFAYGEA